ncbi:CGNR zinc finger domain-containing protein [Promicromonospora panici]|uniref:CGNR zinc finger domain-containing protein n=1 Tax=Promicromonospora panici TaxID=2219658 RepID=UPI00101B9DDA|nr:ABATE domain-containing protein [Promicromonospora panici]
MAEALPLDPRGYRGTYKLIGGAPALDFANLVSYRGTDRGHDWLAPDANAVTWAHAAGLAAPAGDDIAELREFREVLAQVFLDLVDRTTPSSADVSRIGELAASAWGDRKLVLEAGATAATWTATSPTLLAEVALDAASLLTDAAALTRLSACEECRWLFLDTSRNRRRQWCDPADCGNRARQRRHYERNRRSPAR